MKKYQLTINGNQTDTTEHFEIKNPATDELLGYAPIATPEQVAEAIDAAQAAQPAWAALFVEERNGYLQKISEVKVDFG